MRRTCFEKIKFASGATLAGRWLRTSAFRRKAYGWGVHQEDETTWILLPNDMSEAKLQLLKAEYGINFFKVHQPPRFVFLR
jgi:hypothetical protein